MKFLIPVLFMCSTAFAAVPQYNVKMDINLSGERFASQNIVLKDGETTTVFEKHNDEERFVEVESVDGLHMKMTLGRIGQGSERIIMSQSEFKVSENKELNIKSNDLSMSVVAKKKLE